MALIAMAVHDTNENGRANLTRQTLKSLFETVDFNKHRLIIVDNNSCFESRHVIASYQDHFGFQVIRNPENIGTAKAINKAWELKRPGENCIKMDNDVVIKSSGWVDEMEAAIKAEPAIGQIGLKRKDCWEFPSHENPELRSKLHLLPHNAGERWIIVEQAKHIIGTCVMHSAALLEKVGYLYQPGLYGYDDVLMSWRTHLAGFISVFLPHIEIDHIDPGGDEYTDWKGRHSGQYQKLVSDIVDQYIAGTKSIYYEA